MFKVIALAPWYRPTSSMHGRSNVLKNNRRIQDFPRWCHDAWHKFLNSVQHCFSIFTVLRIMNTYSHRVGLHLLSCFVSSLPRQESVSVDAFLCNFPSSIFTLSLMKFCNHFNEASCINSGNFQDSFENKRQWIISR